MPDAGRPYGGPDRRSELAYGVSPEELWTRFTRVESMSEVEPAPIVRRVRDTYQELEHYQGEHRTQHTVEREANEREHRTIRLQVYFFLAAVAGAVGSMAVVRYLGGSAGGP